MLSLSHFFTRHSRLRLPIIVSSQPRLWSNIWYTPWIQILTASVFRNADNLTWYQVCLFLNGGLDFGSSHIYIYNQKLLLQPIGNEYPWKFLTKWKDILILNFEIYPNLDSLLNLLKYQVNKFKLGKKGKTKFFSVILHGKEFS